MARKNRSNPQHQCDERRNRMSKAAQERYDKQNTVFVGLKLNKKTDADIIALLEKSDNKQGTIKKILKEFIKNS